MPAARDIGACSAPGSGSCRRATGIPPVRRSVAVIWIELAMRSRIEIPPEWMSASSSGFGPDAPDDRPALR
ncbi:MAG: hypothetical protein OXN84_07460 [Albidovulum sp.]|nr:hypothetical protein [Albidovulum sp.]MDE0532858.1 hypothetical protein [Albidovulum sp.]